ncbi:MAG: EAL domain-containing protein [Candidatus Devosia phytovorans]|uniref:EAL domain-containing protein n=1 Tax=Candidatus Devosia phytovorans TaxID=3121372 RepID=A0AAJ5VWE6_9HYPH|nr:EAL domain-containing protein [Devosia sp.]WEK05160.1 MAG: EAL domain-containing protein [Devosia sp.]
MSTNVPTYQRWHFSTAMLLPVVLVLGLTAAAVLGFVFWSTATVDERALTRQNSTIRQVIQSKRNQVVRDLSTLAVRDDTVLNAKLRPNPQWIDNNVGKWMASFFDFNRTIIVDQYNTPIYLSSEGLAQDPTQAYRLPGPILGLVDRIRTRPTGSNADGPGRSISSISDFGVVDGVPALIAVATIVSNTGAIIQQPGSEALLIGVMFLDDGMAARINRDSHFDDGRFSLSRSASADAAVFPIASTSGRFVAFFEWDRDRPGLTMLRQTGPVLLVAFAIGSILVFLLLAQLRRSSTALETGRRQAEHQATHDRLTGLPNRMQFDMSLAHLLTEHTGPNTNVALLMLDLDRFKQVNDTLGHQAGDELIRAVGQRIRQVVGADPMIARLGGDEFIVMIADREQIEDAAAIAGRIIEAIGQPFDLHQFKAHVGASIGIVTAGGRGVEPYELMRKADIALYEAKANGRNRHVVYEEHMDEQVQLQHTIEGELREALQRNDQLSVVFQPLVDQASRRIIGAEALARWHHPVYGQISPARFIPVAESTGLILALGDFVLRRACALGAQAPGRTIAVNISPTQLRNPRFAAQVFTVLGQTGMQPGDLELEITESILLDDEHVSSENLRKLRAAGIHIALDDFGTGYSSLSYLKRYPVDRVKIDRSFVIQLAEGHVSVDITRAIVTLAHAMDLEVTAEGVETEGQADILGQLGCNTLQGFLFSGGVTEEQILARFRDADEREEPQPIRAA